MNLSKGCRTLDPAYARDQAEGWMCAQVFNGLVELDEYSHIIPSLSTSWEISDSGKLYRFQLRTDAWFHTDSCFGPAGKRRMVAQDWVWSFTRICDPTTASPGAWIFNGKVEGLEDYQQGRATAISGFTAENDSTFLIRLKAPFAPFLSTLTMPNACVVPHEAVEKYGRDFRAHPVGTGPFCFHSWQEGSSLNFLRNPGYWEKEGDHSLPYLDAINVRFIESELSAFIEFSQGRLDFINNLDASYRDEVMEPGGKIRKKWADAFQFLTGPQLNTEYIAILNDGSKEAAHNSPLLDIRVRRALGMAIDRKKMVAYLLNGNALPAEGGMVPPGTPGFPAEGVTAYGLRYLPDSAAKLLADAGYPGGKGFPALSIKSTPTYQPLMEFVQKSWEVLGIQASVDVLQGGALRDQSSKGDVLLWRAGWIADYPDAESYLSLFYSPNFAPAGPNRSRYHNAAYDSLYASAMHMPDDSSRFSIYVRMDSLMMQDLPVIPLYYDRILRIVQPNIEGMRTNAMNHLFLKSVKKK